RRRSRPRNTRGAGSGGTGCHSQNAALLGRVEITAETSLTGGEDNKVARAAWVEWGVSFAGRNAGFAVARRTDDDASHRVSSRKSIACLPPGRRGNRAYHAPAVHCSSAVDVHYAGGHPAGRPRPLVPIGYLVPATNASARVRLHGGVALVRRRGERIARLGKLALSRERSARPYPGHLVLGRTLLGRPLSQSPVVCESIELGALGHAGIQATSATHWEATLDTATSTMRRPVRLAMAPRQRGATWKACSCRLSRPS